jgi:hypothetical protein
MAVVSLRRFVLCCSSVQCEGTCDFLWHGIVTRRSIRTAGKRSDLHVYRMRPVLLLTNQWSLLISRTTRPCFVLRGPSRQDKKICTSHKIRCFKRTDNGPWHQLEERSLHPHTLSVSSKYYPGMYAYRCISPLRVQAQQFTHLIRILRLFSKSFNHFKRQDKRVS